MSHLRKEKGPRVIGIFTLTMINVAAIISLRNLPLMASYGLPMVAFYALAALFFFVPTALVAAELSTAIPEAGGLYAWVKKAMGPQWGFVAVWLQTVNSFVSFPTMLAFLAGSLAYALSPTMASDKYFNLAVVLVVFWGCTFFNMRGMGVSGWISSVGSILGTILPLGLMVVFGLLWIFSKKHSEIVFSWNGVIPSITSFSQIVFLVGTFFGFSGIEMSAAHVADVEHPRKSYPRAILYSACLILFASLLGSMVIAIVVPKDDITLNAGVIHAIATIFQSYNLPWLTPVIAFFLALGAMASISTWIAGPPRGLVATVDSGILPPLLQKENEAKMPVAIMILQAFVVSFFSLIFLLMPSVKASFWILTLIAGELMLIMYILMFIAVIVLRIKNPHMDRPYKIPGGIIGVCIVAGIGLLTCLFGFFIGFFPPSDMNTGNLFTFELIVIGGTLLVAIPPFVFKFFSKPSWKINQNFLDK